MNKITFEIETLTPMFIAGADQSKAELREASIKGLLRFWWRALQAESNLDELRKRESEIFGSSDEKTGGGATFAIRVISKEDLKPTMNKFPSYPDHVEGKSFKINILEYLAYGTYEYVKKQGNVFKREYYSPNTKFDIVLSYKNEKLKSDILKTFYVWSIFGGIGSRSRNGFGSFNIINKEESFKDIEAETFFSIQDPYVKKNIEKLIQKENIVPYSSFSKGTKLFKDKKSFPSALDSLANIGKIYRNCRIKLEKTHNFEKRQYIGAPIVENKITKSFLDRHAKPYFIKVAREDDKYRSYVLYLPSHYCNGLEEDRNKNKINHSEVDKKFWNICNKFNEFLFKDMETIL